MLRFDLPVDALISMFYGNWLKILSSSMMVSRYYFDPIVVKLTNAHYHIVINV